jgi:hypothetical protein
VADRPVDAIIVPLDEIAGLRAAGGICDRP